MSSIHTQRKRNNHNSKNVTNLVPATTIWLLVYLSGCFVLWELGSALIQVVFSRWACVLLTPKSYFLKELFCCLWPKKEPKSQKQPSPVRYFSYPDCLCHQHDRTSMASVWRWFIGLICPRYNFMTGVCLASKPFLTPNSKPVLCLHTILPAM